MYGRQTTQRAHVRQNPSGIEITEKDRTRFVSLNNNMDRIREAASILQTTHPEMRDLPSDLTLILHAKLQHLNRIKRNINTAASVGNTISMVTLGKTSMVVEFLNIVRENSQDLSRYLLPYFEPDLALEPDSEKIEDRVLVTSTAKTANIAGILQKFKIPEGIAVDIQDICQKGPEPENITSMIVHVFDKFAKKKEKLDSSSFDF